MPHLLARGLVVSTCLAAIAAAGANSVVQWMRAAPFGWSGLHIQFESTFTEGAQHEKLKLKVADVEPRSPASAAGLQRGDRILAMNGSPDDLIDRFAALRPRQSATFLVENGNDIVERTFETSAPFSMARVSLTAAYQVILALVALSIGAFVLIRRPSDARAVLLFILMSLYAALGFSDAGPVYRYGVDSSASLVSILIRLTESLLFFPVLLHLFLIFPARRPVLDKRPSLLCQIYVLPALAAAVLSAFLIAVVVVMPPGSGELRRFMSGFKPGVWLLIGAACVAISGVTILLVYPVAACVACWRNYRDSNPDGRRQLRWPLLGLLLAVGGYALSGPAVFLLWWLRRWETDSLTGLFAWWYYHQAPDFAFLLIPLSIAFAILRYRLFDIDVYIRRTIIYGGLTGLLALVFLLVTGGLGGLLAQRFAFDRDWSPIAATVVASALVLPVRTRIQRAVDTRFYRSRDYPAALARITAGLAADPDNLSYVLEELRDAIPARSACLWLRSTEAPVFELKAHTGRAPESLSQRIPVACAEEQLRASGDYIESLVRGGDTFGYMVIGPKLAENAWDQHDRSFLRALAGQLAMVRSSTAGAAGRDESDRAAEIQRALLPSAVPQSSTVSFSALSHPARVVGGDYYDFIQLTDRRIGLAIADVAGKGIPAALLMSNVQAALRLLAPDVPAPSELCTRLNELMCGNMAPGRFVTFVYGVLDTVSGEFVYCNAGHNAPVVMRDGMLASRLETGGVPLGILPQSSYTEGKVELQPGDELVMFTDGVCDATNEQGEDFGDPGLLQVLSRMGHADDAPRLRDRIFDAVAAHCGGVFSDDVTLLVACFHASRSAHHA